MTDAPIEPTPTPIPTAAPAASPAPTLTESQRSDILSREVAKYVKSGWATESVSNTQAVLVKVKRIGWFWNVILVIITAGLWLIYIIYRALNRKSTRLVLFVNELGVVEKR